MILNKLILGLGLIAKIGIRYNTSIEIVRDGNGINLTIVVGILTIFFTRSLVVELYNALFKPFIFHKVN